MAPQLQGWGVRPNAMPGNSPDAAGVDRYPRNEGLKNSAPPAQYEFISSLTQYES
jgi:hypothetical protein